MTAMQPTNPYEQRFVAVAKIVETVVAWIWRLFLPCAKVCILQGDPDKGKSTLTAHLAARISAGLDLPDGTHSRPRGVIILSGEDGLSDTIRPRLRAAGADLDRILALDSDFDLLDDLEELEVTIEGHDVGLVIVDPIFSFAGSVNLNSMQEARRLLTKLGGVASRTGVAFLLINHYPKVGRGPAMLRGAGSAAIPAAARIVLNVAIDPDDPERRILAVAKSNLAADRPAVAYRLVPSPEVPNQPIVVWDGEVGWSAEELMAIKPERAARKFEAAGDLLWEMLADGARDMSEIRAESARRGIGWRTMEAAKASLDVRVERAPRPGVRGPGGSLWSLPVYPAIPQDAEAAGYSDPYARYPGPLPTPRSREMGMSDRDQENQAVDCCLPADENGYSD